VIDRFTARAERSTLDAPMGTVLYALACVLAPAAWGLAMFYVFGFVDRRRAERAEKPDHREEELPPIDYSI
jgi:hypothetical protein